MDQIVRAASSMQCLRLPGTSLRRKHLLRSWDAVAMQQAQPASGRQKRFYSIFEYHVVGVAQLVEHRIVVPVVAGSSPVSHPIHHPL